MRARTAARPGRRWRRSAAALWWRKNPSACPYGQRFWVEAPHPIITRDRLRSVLAPGAGRAPAGDRPRHRLLHARHGRVGRPRGPGRDLRPPAGVPRPRDRARGERGLANVVPTQGDATELPYEDDSIDAVVLTAVLGEIPDPVAALREIRRVLKPDGRLVVGELFGDPHFTTLGSPQAPVGRSRPRLPRTTPATGSPTSPAWRRLRPPADSSGTSSCAGSRRPGRLRRSACRSGGTVARPGGRRRDRGARAAPRPTSPRAASPRTSSSSSTLSPSSARRGLIRAAKQASLLKMLPIPATSRWSRSASPSRSPAPRASEAERRRSRDRGRGCRGRAGPAPGRARPRSGRAPAASARRTGPPRLGAAEDRPGGSRRPAKRAAGADLPRPAHPEVAVEDEVAEAEEQCLPRVSTPSRVRPSSRSTPPTRPRGFGARTPRASPARAASSRRAALRTVSPSATNQSVAEGATIGLVTSCPSSSPCT